MRSVFRSGFGQNSVARLTTRELGKHRVVSKHPQKPLFCTHTVIFGLKIWKSEQHDELGNVSHSLNEVLRKRQLVPPHELKEVSRYLKRSGLASHGTTREGSLGTSAVISLCSESQSYDVICAVGFFSARGLGCRCHSWRMDALRKGRGLRGRYHS